MPRSQQGSRAPGGVLRAWIWICKLVCASWKKHSAGGKAPGRAETREEGLGIAMVKRHRIAAIRGEVARAARWRRRRCLLPFTHLHRTSATLSLRSRVIAPSGAKRHELTLQT